MAAPVATTAETPDESGISSAPETRRRLMASRCIRPGWRIDAGAKGRHQAASQPLVEGSKAADAQGRLDHEPECLVLHRAPWADAETGICRQALRYSRILGRRDVGYGDKKNYDLDEVHAVRRTWRKARTVSDQRDASRSIRRSQSARVAGPDGGKRSTLEVRVDKVEMIGSKRDDAGPRQEPQKRDPTKAASPKFDDDDILSEEMTVTTELTVVQRAAIALQSETAAAHLIGSPPARKDIAAPTNRAGGDQCHAAAMAALKTRTANQCGEVGARRCHRLQQGGDRRRPAWSR